MNVRRDSRTIALIDELRRLPAEQSCAEFKENLADPQMIGKLISALSNTARIEDRDFGYVVWGVRDDDHAVTGTTFDPDAALFDKQPLQFRLSQKLRPDILSSFDIVEHPEGRLVLLTIPAATTAPVEFDRTAYVRIGSATPRLADHPERQRALWDKLRSYAWEQGVARGFVDDDTVLRLLDHQRYYELIGKPEPKDRRRALEDLATERLIASDEVGGKWNVLNLGAILFARDLDQFELSRKAVRFVAYDGNSRTETVTHRKDFLAGYAVGFNELNLFVDTLTPSPEENGAIIRSAEPLFPPVAVRELIANALIHQDLAVTGAGPTIELFKSRLEITNPGASLVEPERVIDFPPRSRNEALASLMRRMGLCEEQGTGMDKVIDAAESKRLPPPEFTSTEDATRVRLFGPRRFAEMTTEERLRACYQHAVMRHLSGGYMRNRELRERFGVEPRNAAQVSDVIRRALDADLIRIADPVRPKSGYAPFWAVELD